MKMFKKIAAVALAAVMVLAMLTACAGGGSTEDNVLSALNQSRTGTFNRNELVRNDEADAYARDLATVIQKYYNGLINQNAMEDKLYDMFSTSVEGRSYREFFITAEASLISPVDFNDERVAQCDGVYAGIASFSASNHPYTILIVY